MLQTFKDKMPLEFETIETVHKEWARYFLKLKNRSLNA